jgi:murein peptide amidase A
MEAFPQRGILRVMRCLRIGLAIALSLLAGCFPTYSQRLQAQATAGAAPSGEQATKGRVNLSWQAIGYSVKGRPLRAASIGKGPRRVLWVGGIHGDEREGRIATQELPAAFLATEGAAARVTLTILEDVNPDGTALGTRGNANGVDLNRNYPAKNFKAARRFGMEPLSQPEARALHDFLLKGKFDLVIVAHSWHNDHFINFDGPSRDAAELFSARSGYAVRDSGDMSPTPGSLGSWVGRTLGKGILTLEYLRGRDAWAAWEETKSAVLAVVVESKPDARAADAEDEPR